MTIEEFVQKVRALPGVKNVEVEEPYLVHRVTASIELHDNKTMYAIFDLKGDFIVDTPEDRKLVEYIDIHIEEIISGSRPTVESTGREPG